MSLVMLLETRISWSPKDTHKLKVYFDEIFAHVARLESVKLLLAFACHAGFNLFQMDVKKHIFKWHFA